MKFTLAWLKDHLETDASVAQITDALTDLGLEVEEVVDPEATLGAFTICRVLEAKQHPNADRLRVCRVEAWTKGPDQDPSVVQVVCGAPNARTGLIGVFAAPGAHIPGTGLDLKEGEIRGQASRGMLCSGRELTISDDHDGIIELPEDAPLGARYIDYAGLNDPMIEIAITPNRPDALGVRGIARDLAARGLGALKPDAAAPVPGAFENPIKASIDAEARRDGDDAAAACPLFVGRLIRGVTNRPSPDWMQARLRAIGINPKSALVDITNYVAYDRARPLHAFDAGKLEGAIKVRLARAGDRIRGLDEVDYDLEPGMTLITDKGGRRPVAIAGVMGGEATGCSDETTDIYLESAYFDPVRTAATGRRLKIHSDARYRFERGVDPVFTETGAELATQLILDICGGEPSTLTVVGRPPKNGRNGVARKIKLDTRRVESLVGMEIPRREQTRILEALGFELTGADKRVFTAAAPPWRPDVHGEADLVEEVARVASLTGLQAQPLARKTVGVTPTVLTLAQRRVARARRQLAALGLNECVTYSFIAADQAALFGGGDAARKLDNPIAADKTDMRPSLLPGLLTAAARNQARDEPDAALFELGAIFDGGEPGEQRDVATALRVGQAAERAWSGERRPIDVFDLKRDALAILETLGAPVDKLSVDRAQESWLHPGRSANVKLGPKTTLAVFGELHPRILAAFDLKGPAAAMTVFLGAIPAPKAKSKSRPALARHDLQRVARDFAFVVDAGVEAADILRAARAADKKLIVDARVFDVFDGDKAAAQLGAAKKSVAISVTLQPTAKTLTDEEIEAVAAKVVAGVTAAVAAELRA